MKSIVWLVATLLGVAYVWYVGRIVLEGKLSSFDRVAISGLAMVGVYFLATKAMELLLAHFEKTERTTRAELELLQRNAEKEDKKK